MRRIICIVLIVAIVPASWSTDLSSAQSRVHDYQRELEQEQDRLQRYSRMRLLSGVGLVAASIGVVIGVTMGIEGYETEDSELEARGDRIAGLSLFVGVPITGIPFALAHNRYRRSASNVSQLQLDIRNERNRLRASAAGAPVMVRDVRVNTRVRDGNTRVSLNLENISDKTIKYVYVSLLPYNRVNDVITTAPARSLLRFAELVGPIDSGRQKRGRFVSDWDSLQVDKVRIEALEVVFMDDSTWRATDGNRIARKYTVDDTRYANAVAAITYVPPFEVMPDVAGVPGVTGFGSGFFISDAGHFVTNHHVIRDAETIEIEFDGSSYNASVLISDPSVDLAILLVEGIQPNTYRWLRINDRQAAIGEEVFTIGFPNPTTLGFSPKFSNGTISSLRGIRDDPRQYQISVPVQPGNSGGPLVNSRGIVTGVIVGRLSDWFALYQTGMLPQNVNYAVKSTRLVALLQDLGLEDLLDQANDETEDVEDLNAFVLRSVAPVITR